MTTYTWQLEKGNPDGTLIGDVTGITNDTGSVSLGAGASQPETVVLNDSLVGLVVRWRVTDGVTTKYTAWSEEIAAAGSGPPDPAAPAWLGPWFSTKSPWRTPIPLTSGSSATGLDWTHYVHPDTAAMVMSVFLGTNFSSKDIHAWAYDEADMLSKGFPAIDSHWFGPGGVENVVYGRSTDPFITVYMDYPSCKASSISCPLPINWTGYDTQSAGERRTIVVCDDGRAWVLYGLTPPNTVSRQGCAADGFWHAADAFQVQNWTDINLTWAGGGSGLAFGGGLLLPRDIAYARVNGDFGHVLAINAVSSAIGTYNGPNGLHPSGVWPATKGLGGTGGDGRTQGAPGIPHGAIAFLDPSLSDSDLEALGLPHKSPDDWPYWFAHNHQRYGVRSKESNSGQGETGAIMCETVQSIAWNAAHGVPGYSGFRWPWFVDGTVTGDHDSSTYNAAFPKALMPLDTTHGGPGGSHWKIFDWTKSYPGITVPA